MVHVTFDTNVYTPVASRADQGQVSSNDVCSQILQAIKAGKISPYISEATLTFELLPVEDRVHGILRQYALGHQTPTPKTPLPSAASQRVKKAVKVGFKVLRAVRAGLASWITIPKEAYAPDTRFPREERLKRYNQLCQAFDHIGPCRLKALGVKLVRTHNLDTSIALHLPGSASPEQHMWADGLLAELRNPKQYPSQANFLGEVGKMFSDWFDLDSVASHYGYGLDYYCTQDTGRGSPDWVIFHPENREHLSEYFGIRIVDPETLLCSL